MKVRDPSEEENAEPAEEEEAEEEPFEDVEKLTSVSALISPSIFSKLSSNTYIMNLQSQLRQEQIARKHLERELLELKQISTDINTQLSEIKQTNH